MTSLEMIDRIGVLRDLYRAPFYENSEYEEFINSAISFIVSNAAGIKNGKKGAAEVANIESQKAWDQIASIIKTQNLPIISGSQVTDILDYGTAMVVKPADYWYWAYCRVLINGVWRKTYPSALNLINSNLEDAFAEPEDDNVLVVFNENKIIFCCNTVPQAIKLTYIRKPAKVVIGSVNCDLPESVHDEICHLAVSISAPGSRLYEMYQISSMEANKR